MGNKVTGNFGKKGNLGFWGIIFKWLNCLRHGMNAKIPAPVAVVVRAQGTNSYFERRCRGFESHSRIFFILFFFISFLLL